MNTIEAPSAAVCVIGQGGQRFLFDPFIALSEHKIYTGTGSLSYCPNSLPSGLHWG